MTPLVDFTNCPRVPGRAYNGANGKKIAVEYEQDVWLLKFPPSAADKPNDLSYSNSCISEHLGSSVFRLLTIPVQETKLGLYVNGKTKVVCACRDFTVPDKRVPIPACAKRSTDFCRRLRNWISSPLSRRRRRCPMCNAVFSKPISKRDATKFLSDYDYQNMIK